MQARRARAEAAVAVWQAEARAAQRRPLHHRSGGDAAGAARTQARDRERAAGELRTLARALSRSASCLGGWAPALICWPRTARSLSRVADATPQIRSIACVRYSATRIVRGNFGP